MYRCIIIDDELHAIEGLKEYIRQTKELTLVNFYTDPVIAMQEIAYSDAVDLILLDVDMPEISGIELATSIRKKTSKLVFTTAHTKYGFEAFQVEADGYLLKPYTLAKFMSTIQALFKPKSCVDEMETFFFIKSKEDNPKLIKVVYDEIVAIESKLNYILIHTMGKSILTYMSLTEISNKLSSERGFSQFHRSYILNTVHIESIEGNTITMTNGKKMAVGEFYRKAFNEFISKKVVKSKRKQ
jgi:DNA-binding LytR/AlgR family response regulator